MRRYVRVRVHREPYVDPDTRILRIVAGAFLLFALVVAGMLAGH